MVTSSCFKVPFIISYIFLMVLHLPKCKSTKILYHFYHFLGPLVFYVISMEVFRPLEKAGALQELSGSCDRVMSTDSDLYLRSLS